MISQVKRRQFSQAEDLMLLRQVNAERPYEAPAKGIMKLLTSAAAALSGREEFTRADIDAKKAQYRFNVLLSNHRSFNKESVKASGDDGVYDERTELLDELLVSYDDMKEQQKERAVKVDNEAQRNENEGSIVRSEALSSLGKRKRGVKREQRRGQIAEND
ncbi:hypothetical protein DYB25_012128, partial [Aphanomyces astaci]